MPTTKFRTPELEIGAILLNMEELQLEGDKVVDLDFTALPSGFSQSQIL
jgi:hypothetical protein